MLLSQRASRFVQDTNVELAPRSLEPPLRPGTFVGRDLLLLNLSRGLELWRQGPRPGVLLLSGPAGCGKSRVAEELLVPFLAAGQ